MSFLALGSRVWRKSCLHDGDADEELLHLAEQALNVLSGSHAQLRSGAPVQLADGAQGRQARHRAWRHSERLLPRLEQQICGLRPDMQHVTA